MRAEFCLLAPILFIAALSPASGAQAPATEHPRTLSVSEAISLYARGEFDAAVQRLDSRNLLVRQFTRALDAWIADGDQTSLLRRKCVAAAFTLDAGWHATRNVRDVFRISGLNADPWHGEPRDIERWRFAHVRAQPVLVEWVIDQLPASSREAVDHAMILASVGFAQDGHAWYRLQDEILPRARKWLGNHSRLRLAEVIARTNRELGTLRAFTWPASLGVLRDETPPNGAVRRIGAAVTAFTTLLDDPDLAGEVELRIGYLELRRKQWAAALSRFEAARLQSVDTVVRATADYFAGWVHEQRGQTQDAIVAYRRAHAITPLMRNLTTRLAALLFLRGDRHEAFELLDGAVHARPAPLDLMFEFERADARFVPAQLVSIRKALQ